MRLLSILQSKEEDKDQESIDHAIHLTQDTYGKVTTSQLDISNESEEVIYSQSVTTRQKQTSVYGSITKQNRNNINDPQKKNRLGMVSKNILLQGINQFNGAPTSPLVQMWIKTHKCLVCMKNNK